jgi:hypothetical protein
MGDRPEFEENRPNDFGIENKANPRFLTLLGKVTNSVFVKSRLICENLHFKFDADSKFWIKNLQMRRKKLREASKAPRQQKNLHFYYFFFNSSFL